MKDNSEKRTSTILDGNDRRVIDCIEHHLLNLNERVAIADVIPHLPDDFMDKADDAQHTMVAYACSLI